MYYSFFSLHIELLSLVLHCVCDVLLSLFSSSSFSSFSFSSSLLPPTLPFLVPPPSLSLSLSLLLRELVGLSPLHYLLLNLALLFTKSRNYYYLTLIQCHDISLHSTIRPTCTYMYMYYTASSSFLLPLFFPPSSFSAIFPYTVPFCLLRIKIIKYLYNMSYTYMYFLCQYKHSYTHIMTHRYMYMYMYMYMY